jgi:hypothetical protein
MRFLSLRALFLLTFVVAMPVLALPPVARWIDELLYGPPPAEFGRPPAPVAEQLAPVAAERVAPVSFEGESPATSAGPHGLDAAVAVAPPLAPPPAFAPVAPPPAAPEAPLDEPTLARLQQIRQRLEDLGADYIVVDTLESGGYRCLCRMLVDPRSRFTRPFEATAAAPLAAGEQVLRDVEQWRAVGVENRARPQ